MPNWHLAPLAVAMATLKKIAKNGYFFTFAHTESLLLVVRAWELHQSHIQVIPKLECTNRYDLALTVIEILTFEL